MSKWREWMKAQGEEPPADAENAGQEHGGAEDEGNPQEEEKPQPMVMTADAVQAMLDKQAEQMSNSMNALVHGLQTSLAPKADDGAQEVPMPTDAEIKKALDEGDTEGFMRLQKQKDLAMATAFDNRMRQLETQSHERMLQLQEKVVESAVPDEYRKEVNAMMDDLGVDREVRTNPKVLELLTLAAKGKHADAEKAAALEAAKRKQNLEPTGDVSANRQNPGHGGGDEPVFSDDARAALTTVGRDQDNFAKGMGYKDWADYEAATRDLAGGEVVTHRWMAKVMK